MIVKLSDFDIPPCKDYKDLSEEFEVIEEIKKRRGKLCLKDFSWAIAHCEKLHEIPILKMFLQHNPTEENIEYIAERHRIKEFKNLQEAFFNARPTAMQIFYFVGHSGIYVSEEIATQFLVTKPTADEIGKFMYFCIHSQCFLDIIIQFFEEQPTEKEVNMYLKDKIYKFI